MEIVPSSELAMTNVLCSTQHFFREVEDHINKNDDFNTSIGVAVRVDKFSDSSIDMYVRCFTKTDSWNEWLSVKERLALEIKQIVESNKASFAFPSQSIYIEKK